MQIMSILGVLHKKDLALVGIKASPGSYKSVGIKNDG
jgi:hypothetical protein